MKASSVKQVHRLYEQDMDLITLHGKRPIRAKGWVSAPRALWEQLEQDLLSNGANIGVRCGHPLGEGYHGVIDVDNVAELTPEEQAEQQALLDELLDGQKAVEVTSGFGYGSRHLHVVTAEPEPKRKLWRSKRVVTYIKDGVEKTGPVWQIEYMGLGSQVVLPPSTHPDTGKVYKWGKRGAFKAEALPLVELPKGRAKAQPVANGAAEGELLVPEVDSLHIAPHFKALIVSGDCSAYPSRSEGLFAALVVLCRDTPLDDEHLMALILDPANGIGDKAREKGAGAAVWLAQQVMLVRGRVQEERQARRGTAPGGATPPGQDEVQHEGGDPIEELFARHSLVLWGGRPAVFRERIQVDEVNGRWEILSPQVLKALYQNKKVWVGQGDDAKQVNPVDLWMASPDRREYLEGARLVCPPAEGPQGVFNLWEGWGVEPHGSRVSDKQVAPWLEFVLEIICAGDKGHAAWVHDWLADLFQDPGHPKGVALVLRSGEGTGKGTFCDLLGRICGAHYRHVTQESQLTGKFNSHFAGSILVNANEMAWAVDRRSRGSLYSMVTDHLLMMERKGFDSVPMLNHNHFVISGNMDWLVPAGLDARRWMVLDVAETWAGQSRRFGELKSWAVAEGLQLMLAWYQQRKVKVDLRRAPITEGLVDQKVANMDSFQVWWHEVLERGRVVPRQPWPDSKEHMALKDHVYASYLNHCKEASVRVPFNSIRFYRRLHKLVPGLVEVRSSREEGRKRMLCFPDLDTVQEAGDRVLRGKSGQ